LCEKCININRYHTIVWTLVVVPVVVIVASGVSESDRSKDDEDEGKEGGYYVEHQETDDTRK
jgi:hypothetical protein